MEEIIMDFARLTHQLDALPGHIGVYYKDLTSGETFSYHAEDAFSAASVIKLPMMAAIAHRVSSGDASWEERLIAKNEYRVPPCGALWFFRDEPSVRLDTLCQLMITISDNMATNMLMRRFTIDDLNADFRRMGLHTTHLERLLFDSEASKQGKKNYFAPREIGDLLEDLYLRSQKGDPDAVFCMETLLDQQINHKIPGYLPDVSVAHKTGEDDGITHDVGIVLCDRPFLLCFASNDTDVPAAERLLRQLALDLSN